MLKKYIGLVLTIVLICESVFTFNIVYASEKFNGDGTENSPYLIQTIEDMNKLATSVNSGNSYEGVYFLLTNDLNYDNTSNNYTPIGKNGSVFSGDFNGNYKIIQGLNISSGSKIGIFGMTGSNAKIHNVVLFVSKVSGSTSVGGIVGYNQGKVYNCFNGANISGSNEIGGIVGASFGSNSQIYNCSNHGVITYTWSGGGGILGYGSTNVSYSYNAGSVSGPKNLGGIIGEGEYIYNCYNISNINTGYRCGSLIGASGKGSDAINNSYYLHGSCNCAIYQSTMSEIAVSIDEIKSYSFVSAINNGSDIFLYDAMNINQGYPITYWEYNILNKFNEYMGIISDNNEYLNDEIVINGRGNAILRYKLIDSSYNLLKNKQVKYSISGYSEAYEGITDENGLLEIKTPELTSTTELTITITALDGTEILDNVKTTTITVKPLSYSQKWTGQVGASLKGKLGAGAGVEAGPASAEAQVASASLRGDLSKSLSLKNEYDDGQRNLTISSTMGAGVDGKVEAGLFANASYKNTAKKPTVKVDLASIGANAKGGTDITKNLEIKNYNPQDDAQLLNISYFLLDSTLDSSSNALSKLMLDTVGLIIGESYNAEETSFTLDAGAGADVGKVEIFDNGVSLFTLGGETIWKSTYGTDSEGNNEYGSSLGTSADFSIGSLATSMRDGGKNVQGTGTSVSVGSLNFLNNEIESKIKSNNGDILDFSLTAQEKENSTNVFLWSGSDSYEKTITYKDSEAKTAVASDSTMSNLAVGKEGFINPISFANAVNNVLNSGADGEYSRNNKYTQGMEFPISFGLQALAGLTVGVDLSGVETEKFEFENGVLIDGILYKQSESTAKSDMDSSKQTLGSMLYEPLDYLSGQLVELFDSTSGKVGEMIQQGQATIESMKNTVADGFKNCQVTVSKFMGGASTYSMAVLAIDDETATTDTSSVAFTVGETYIVGLTDEEGNEIIDFSENPLKITLNFTEEELAAAGLNNTGDELQNLKIYRYDSDKKVYVCVGGTLDFANKCVSTEITCSGQYILACDSCAPSVTEFTALNYTTKPTFTANVADVSGLSDFSFKIDDKEYVNYNNLYDYYSDSNAWFEYPLNEELVDGNHTASITATDSAGNKMVNAITIDFVVDTSKPVFESLDVNTDSENNIIVSANVSDSNISDVTAYVTTLGTTYTYDLQNTSDTVWSNQIEVPEGVAEVTVVVKAYDTAGNCSESEMQLLDLEKFVLGDADDNGIISNADAACILKKNIDSNYIMPVENTHTNYIKVVDMDGNGTIDLLDAIAILNLVKTNE